MPLTTAGRTRSHQIHGHGIGSLHVPTASFDWLGLMKQGNRIMVVVWYASWSDELLRNKRQQRQQETTFFVW
eukprot:scaffold2230_cov187-Amphora_coffeaeformis.AAC.5